MSLYDPAATSGRFQRIHVRDLWRSDLDVMLAGHHHKVGSEETATLHALKHRSVILVQAGTTTSTRRRGETNSFNVIRVDGGRIEVTPYCWGQAGFAPNQPNCFKLTPEGWRKA